MVGFAIDQSLLTSAATILRHKPEPTYSLGSGIPCKFQVSSSHMNWPFLALTLVCAGFVQGMTGFGFGLLSMSLMPLFIGVKQAAAISTVFSFLATITTFIRHYREYHW